MKYDIFISYRRDDGAQYARILQLELEKRGYRIFLDYEELTDGVFGDDIKDAVKDAPIFMMVLTPLYLERCMEISSWVREEITLAIESKKHFVPVDPDRRFNGIPLSTPENIAGIVSSHQHSSIDFGQALGPTIDMMVRKRIAPHVKNRKTLISKRLLIITIFLILSLGGISYFFLHQAETHKEFEELKSMAEKKAKHIEEICEQYINWSPDITKEQLQVINSILENMVEVQGGDFLQGAYLQGKGSFDELVCPELEVPPIPRTVESFFMSMYEVSVSDWCIIMQQPFELVDSLLPMTNVTFHECQTFTTKLVDLTGLNFRIPTESEWEYAARGGAEPDKTIFAGSDNPEDVAWYCKNSGGKPHVCDATNSPLRCNAINLYDMSGNVAEWTGTLCHPYNDKVIMPDDSALAVRGGNFDSHIREITVFHRESVNPRDKDVTIGLRLVISK